MVFEFSFADLVPLFGFCDLRDLPFFCFCSSLVFCVFATLRLCVGVLRILMGTLKVKIWRGTESGQFQNYEVPRQESQTVLDVVTYVQRKCDPTLS